MTIPKKMKYRKVFKGRIKGFASAGSGLQFGDFGFKSCEAGRMSEKQIEAARKCVSRAMKREGKFWIRVFPHTPVTSKASGNRMGGGKGNIDRYIAKIYPGSMLFEVSGVTEDVARQAFALAKEKLCVKGCFVKKEEGVYVEYN